MNFLYLKDFIPQGIGIRLGNHFFFIRKHKTSNFEKFSLFFREKSHSAETETFSKQNYFFSNAAIKFFYSFYSSSILSTS